MSSNKEIKNKIAYFTKVVQNMNNKNLRQNIKINEFERLSDEIEENYYKLDEYFNGDNLLDWIELIENADLHRALKSLSIEEQTLKKSKLPLKLQSAENLKTSKEICLPDF